MRVRRGAMCGAAIQTLPALLRAAVCMAVEKAASRTQQSNIEKHQVVNVVPSGTANTLGLSRANSRLVQIDLAFATAAPFLISFLTSESRFGYRWTIPVLVVIQIAIAILTVPLVLRISRQTAASASTGSQTRQKGNANAQPRSQPN